MKPSQNGANETGGRNICSYFTKGKGNEARGDCVQYITSR